jgi:hypothetical protein
MKNVKHILKENILKNSIELVFIFLFFNTWDNIVLTYAIKPDNINETKYETPHNLHKIFKGNVNNKPTLININKVLNNCVLFNLLLIFFYYPAASLHSFFFLFFLSEADYVSASQGEHLGFFLTK